MGSKLEQMNNVLQFRFSFIASVNSLSMAKLTLLCALLVFGILTSDATTQHMICETVKDVFSGEGTQQSVPRPIILPFSVPFPVGKLGPRGEKGDPGSAGVPGSVNQLDLEALIDEKVNAATATLREEVDKLQRDVEMLSDARVNATEVPNTTPETRNGTDPCSVGFVYREKCYFTAEVTDGSVYADFSRAKQMCINRGGKIADIWNLEHQEMAEDELRKSIEQNYIQVWIATTYSPSDRTLHMSNGTTMNVESFRWYSSRFPSSKTSDTSLGLDARPRPIAGGIYNIAPSSRTYGALCVK